MREKLRGGCDIPNVESVLDLLQRFGVCGLGGCDGCDCAHFLVLGISVDVSCAECCVRVHSGYLGFDQSELVPIAREVLSQLSSPQSYAVRFCDYSSDHKNGRWENGVLQHDQECCYCGKPRNDVSAYLCEHCLSKQDALDSYPANLDDLAKAILFEFASAEKAD